MQIITMIRCIILNVQSMIKKAIVTNHTFFAVVTLSKINFFYQFYRNATFIISNLQKDFHQDNLSFVRLQAQFPKYNCR